MVNIPTRTFRKNRRGEEMNKLIWKLVHSFKHRFPSWEPEDLFQECQIWAIQAQEKFVPGKAKFSTYLYNALKNNLIQLANKEIIPKSLLNQGFSELMYVDTGYRIIQFQDELKNLPAVSMYMLENLANLDLICPKKVRGILKKKAAESGFTAWEIAEGLRALKTMANAI